MATPSILRISQKGDHNCTVNHEKQEDGKVASLSLKNICKKYPNGFEAVKDFNLEIEDKEFIIFRRTLPVRLNLLHFVWLQVWRTSPPVN